MVAEKIKKGMEGKAGKKEEKESKRKGCNGQCWCCSGGDFEEDK